MKFTQRQQESLLFENSRRKLTNSTFSEAQQHCTRHVLPTISDSRTDDGRANVLLSRIQSSRL